MNKKSKIVVLLAGIAVSATAATSSYAQTAGGNQPTPPNMENCQPGTPGQGPCGEGMGPQANGPQGMGQPGQGPQAMDGRGMGHGKWGRQTAFNDHGRRGHEGFGRRGMGRDDVGQRGMGQRGMGPDGGSDMMFQRADKDNSGTLTLEEFEAASPFQIAEADANSDGNVNVDELTNAMMREMMKRRAEGIIARFDTNKDGQVSTEELQDSQKRMFARLDIDGSGVIEQDEMRAPQGDMRGRGPGGDGPRDGHGMRRMHRMNDN